ncbi:uncharacterized protein ACB058_008446 [Synchiropus picturatus]
MSCVDVSDASLNIESLYTTPVIEEVSHSGSKLYCSTWGNYHFKTFGGRYFNFPSTCNYVLASECKGYEGFYIHLQRQEIGGTVSIRSVTIKLDGFLVELFQSAVNVNYETINLPFSKYGVYIDRDDPYITIEAEVGLTIKWNEKDSLWIELTDADLMNQICGLCAVESFNEGYHMSPYSVDTFKIDGSLDCEESSLLSYCERSQRRETCQSVLWGRDSLSCMIFIDINSFINACVEDLCSCNNSDSCLCSTIKEFSRQCAHAGGFPQLSNAFPQCEVRKCPLNMEYKECGSACKDTCSNPRTSDYCAKDCVEGCSCPQGTVLDDITETGCVPVDKCPCLHDGKPKKSGESYTKKCQTCTCFGGEWRCSYKNCPGECTVRGGSHVTTFDGKTYTFHGDCSYILSKDENGTFTISGDLAKCEASALSCLLAVSLHLPQSTKIVVDFKGQVFINNLMYPLPLKMDHVHVFRPSTFYIIVETSHGLMLVVQLTPIMQLSIRAGTSYKRNLQGLCGDFNDIEADDYKNLNGLTEKTAPAFINTWVVRKHCPEAKRKIENPCSLSMDKEKYALESCSSLSDPHGIFAKCHSEIDPEEYEATCIYDTCTCRNSDACMCAAIASYVQACAAEGVSLTGWRDNMCQTYTTICPSTFVYDYQMTSCGRTCRSLSQPDQTCQVEFTPVDGCGCAEGTYLNEESRCVDASLCPCYMDDIVVKPGQSTRVNGQICSCRDGKLHCSEGPLTKTAVCTLPMVFFNCSNEKFDSKGSECQKTCQSVDTECESSHCVSGCVCPAGLLADNKGGCIKEEQCPCTYNKKLYNPGEQIAVDCNTCICNGKKWNCTTLMCDRTFSVYGDGHFLTFDEKEFHFKGDCSYILCQDFCGGDEVGSFKVLAKGIPTSKIELYLGNKKIEMSEEKVKIINTNNGNETSYHLRPVGKYMVIEAENGLILMWDRKATLMIKLSASFKGKVCGPCGNFDGNIKNDFTTRNKDIVADAYTFVNSWKVSPKCPDSVARRHPCTIFSYRMAWAERHCSIIRSQVFADCHSKVSWEGYYEACVKDMCECDPEDRVGFCSVVAAYAAACSEAGACVRWRTPAICPIFCDYYNHEEGCEWHYEPCGKPCMKTCRNPSGMCYNQIPALEGCYPRCPDEKPFLEDVSMQCVSIEQCGCYDDEGRHYGEGEVIPHQQNCHECICSSTNMNCTYNIQECTCKYGGKLYKYNETIYDTHDGNGTCIIAICGENGNIERVIKDCVTSTTERPTTTFSFSTSEISTTIVTTTPRMSTPLTTEVTTTTPTTVPTSSISATTKASTTSQSTTVTGQTTTTKTTERPTTETSQSTTRTTGSSTSKPTSSTTTKSTTVTGETTTTTKTTERPTTASTETSQSTTRTTGSSVPTTTTPFGSSTAITSSIPTATSSTTKEHTSTSTSTTTTTQCSISCKWSDWINDYTGGGGDYELLEEIAKFVPEHNPNDRTICSHNNHTIRVINSHHIFNTDCNVKHYQGTHIHVHVHHHNHAVFNLLIIYLQSNIVDNYEIYNSHRGNHKNNNYYRKTNNCNNRNISEHKPNDRIISSHTIDIINRGSHLVHTTNCTGFSKHHITTDCDNFYHYQGTHNHIHVHHHRKEEATSFTPPTAPVFQNTTSPPTVTTSTTTKEHTTTSTSTTTEKVSTTTTKASTTPQSTTSTGETTTTTKTTERPTTTSTETSQSTTRTTGSSTSKPTSSTTSESTTSTGETATTTKTTERPTTTSTETSQSTTRTTGPSVPTTTTPFGSSTATTSSTPTATTSTTTKEHTTTSTSTTTQCLISCNWSDWINSNTGQGGGGDYELLEEIAKSVPGSCRHPEEIECREVDRKVPFNETGQEVKCDVTFGLICYDKDQVFQVLTDKCYDYEIRVKCCFSECLTAPTPTSTTIKSTSTSNPTASTTTVSTTVTGETTKTTERPTTTSTETFQSTTRTTGSSTSKPTSSTTSESTTSTGETATTTKTTQRPTTTSTETSQSTTRTTGSSTSKPTSSTTSESTTSTGETATTTKTTQRPTTTSTETSQSTTRTTGSSTSKPTSSTTSESTTSTGETATTTKTTERPTTTSTETSQSTTRTTGSSTSKPTSSTTSESTTSTGETATTTKTTERPTTTSTETSQSTTRTTGPSVPTTTTPFGSSTATTSSTPTATTSTTTKEHTTTSTSTTTQCLISCNWSDWINSNTGQGGGGDYELLEEIAKSVPGSCRHPEEIECREVDRKVPFNETGQEVKCDVTFGLICYDKDQVFQVLTDKCYDYEIRVKCCFSECLTAPTPTSTTIKSTSTSNPTASTTTVSTTVTGETTKTTERPTTTSTETFQSTTRTTGSSTSKPTSSTTSESTTSTGSSTSKPTSSTTSESTTSTGETATTTKTTERPTTATTETSQSTTRTTGPSVPTTTTPFGSSTATTSSTPTATTSTTTKEHTTTSTSTTTQCLISCNWSDWINNNTGQGGGGDYELLEEIAKSVPGSCRHPEEIECREVDGKVPFNETGQEVKCDVAFGLICYDKDQVLQVLTDKCYDYEIRVKCCFSECLTAPTPTSTTIKSTSTSNPTASTTTVSTTVTGETTITTKTTQRPTTTSTETSQSTTRTTESSLPTPLTSSTEEATSFTPPTAPVFQNTTSSTPTVTTSTTTKEHTTTSTSTTTEKVSTTTTKASTTPQSTTSTGETTTTTKTTERPTTTSTETSESTTRTTGSSTSNPTSLTTTKSTTVTGETTRTTITTERPTTATTETSQSTSRTTESSLPTPLTSSTEEATSFTPPTAPVFQNTTSSTPTVTTSTTTKEHTTTSTSTTTEKVSTTTTKASTTPQSTTSTGETTTTTKTTERPTTTSTETSQSTTRTTGSSTSKPTSSTTSESTTSTGETATTTKTTERPTTTSTETSLSTTRTTGPSVPTTTTPFGSSTATTSSTPTATTSTTTKEHTTTSTSTTTQCLISCNWSDWINNNTGQGGGGDYELLEEIAKSVPGSCRHPEEIECREVDRKVPFNETGQEVKCDVTFGLICYDKDQVFQVLTDKCYDYEIRVKCCFSECLTAPTPTSTTIKSTSTSNPTASTTTVSTTVTGETTKTTERPTTTSTETFQSTTRTTGSSTSKPTSSTTSESTTSTGSSTSKPTSSTTSESTTSTGETATTTKTTERPTTATTETSQSTTRTTGSSVPTTTTPFGSSTATTSSTPTATTSTTTKEHASTSTSTTTTTQCLISCNWSDWINNNTGQGGGGDYELLEEIAKSVPGSCRHPEEIECREVDRKVPFNETGQEVKCDVTFGLICYDKDQVFQVLTDKCYDYEIRVKCCFSECLTAPTPTSTTINSTSTSNPTASITSESTTVTGETTKTTERPTTTSTETSQSTTRTTGSSTSKPTSSTTSESTTSTGSSTSNPTASTNTESTTSTGETTKTTERPTTTSTETSQSTTRTTGSSTSKPTSSTTSESTTSTGETATTTKTTERPTTATTETSQSTTRTTGSSVPTTTTPFRSSTKEATASSTLTVTMSLTTIPTTTEETRTTSQTTMKPTYSTTERLTTSEVASTLHSSTPRSTTPCSCVYMGETFPPGSYIYNKTDEEAWCFIAYCNVDCVVDKHSIPCQSTTTPSSTTVTATQSCTTTLISICTSPHPPENCSFLVPPRQHGETWKPNKCVTKTCYDGEERTTHVPCGAVTVPQCENGYPPVKVYDEDGCCFHYECQCICSGWGGPHYATFDGRYYSYQKNCTYVLVQEVAPRYNFSVTIDNKNCDAHGDAACVKALTVNYKNYEIVLTQGTDTKGVLKALVNGTQVIPAYSNKDFSVISTAVKLVLRIPAIHAIVTFKGLFFTIELPPSHFYNNTAGQCGNCDNNASNDCRFPNGRMNASCSEMADHWQIPDKNMTYCATPPPKGPEPCTNKSDLCELLLSKVFDKCHSKITPEQIYMACQYDTCRMPNTTIGCSSLEMYAELCGEASVCIDWRNATNGTCEYKCPGNKVYNPCIDHDTEPTCNARYNDKLKEKIQNSSSSGSKVYFEGCVCPEGTTLFSSRSDLCVTACCTGPDGKPKQPGDNWQSGCQQCVCDGDTMGVECSNLTCSTPEPVICNNEGEVMVTRLVDCCPTLVCECDRSQCSLMTTRCPAGFEPQVSFPNDTCCPSHTCVAKGVCVFNNTEFKPGVTFSKSLCESCICTKDQDPVTKLNRELCSLIECHPCGLGYENVAYPGQCCGSCNKTSCVFRKPGSQELKILTPSQSWSPEGDNCTVFECVMANGEITLIESTVSCTFDPENCIPGTEHTDKSGCCTTCIPKPECKPRTNTTYLYINGCKSVAEVEITECEGTCGASSSMYSADSNTMMHSCACCQEISTSVKEVEMNCPDGTKKMHNYTSVDQCGCKAAECATGSDMTREAKVGRELREANRQKRRLDKMAEKESKREQKEALRESKRKDKSQKSKTKSDQNPNKKNARNESDTKKNLKKNQQDQDQPEENTQAGRS